MECGISVNGQASAVHHCQPTRITRQQSHANWPLVGLVQAGLGFRRVGGSGGSGVQAGGRFRRVWGSGGWTVQEGLGFRRVDGSGDPLVQAAPWFRRVWGSGGPLVQAGLGFRRPLGSGGSGLPERNRGRSARRCRFQPARRRGAMHR